MKPFNLILILLLLSFGVSLAQSKRLQRADAYYQSGEYTKALDIYMKLYSKARNRQEKAELAFKIGLVMRQLDNPRQQVNWFRRALTYKYPKPEVYLYLADAYRMLGSYETAADYYNQYLELVPDDQRAKWGLQSCELAPKWLEKPTRYVVNFVPRINSRYNDFAPAISASDTSVLYFTSTRPASKGKKINPNTAQAFADIYITQIDKKGFWAIPQPIPGEINTQMEEGSCYISPDGQTMYFTRCPNYKDKNIGCQIYKATKIDNQWQIDGPIRLFQDSTISVGQPYLTDDQLTMYFVSDNPQGFGGKDIWMVKRPTKNSPWGIPQNLGPEINTPEDEIYPTLDKDGNLYFASRGHINMGGFDIFVAKKVNGKWKVENLKYPVNTNMNEYSIIFIDKNKGYLASNRFLRSGDDIFKFWIRPVRIQLKGLVLNEKTKISVEYATVIIQASDGTERKIKTDYDGNFKISLKPNTDYFIITEKEGFFRAKTAISTMGINQDTTLYIEIPMQKMDQIVKLPNIRYYFNDTTLRPESKAALDKLIELLKLNPGIKIEIMAHTDYRGSEEYNLRLSQGRANSVVDYLVKHGIDPSRLVAKGYGESKPFVVDKETAEKYPFLKEGQVLTQEFIESLPSEEQREICNELNRRTEFRVIGKIENYEKFGATPVSSDTSNTQSH